MRLVRVARAADSPRGGQLLFANAHARYPQAPPNRYRLIIVRPKGTSAKLISLKC